MFWILCHVWSVCGSISLCCVQLWQSKTIQDKVAPIVFLLNSFLVEPPPSAGAEVEDLSAFPVISQKEVLTGRTEVSHGLRCWSANRVLLETKCLPCTTWLCTTNAISLFRFTFRKPVDRITNARATFKWRLCTQTSRTDRFPRKSRIALHVKEK